MAQLKERIKAQSVAVKKEVKKQLLTYVIASLGLVGGLAWNEAIKALIEYFFPLSQNTIFAKLIYAVIITLIIVIVSYSLAQMVKEEETQKAVVDKEKI